MHLTNPTRWFSADAMERLPWAVRALLGCSAAALAAALTYTIAPLRAFPLLLAFPTVILGAWFLGMWGGVFCAVTEAFLVDWVDRKTEGMRITIGDAGVGMHRATLSGHDFSRAENGLASEGDLTPAG